MTAILSIDRNYAIGFNGDLLFKCSEDLKRFRQLTTGKTVVMGRKTLQSLPKQSPLPNRKNIVLSNDVNFKVQGATVCNSIEQLLEQIADIPSEDVMVMGGAEIYRLLLPYTDRIYITKFDTIKQADSFFVNIDELSDWRMSEQSEEMLFDDIKYQYITYERVKGGKE